MYGHDITAFDFFHPDFRQRPAPGIQPSSGYHVAFNAGGDRRDHKIAGGHQFVQSVDKHEADVGDRFHLRVSRGQLFKAFIRFTRSAVKRFPARSRAHQYDESYRKRVQRFEFRIIP